MIRSIARRELSETSRKVSTAGRREMWWWNQKVQEKLKDKKILFFFIYWARFKTLHTQNCNLARSIQLLRLDTHLTSVKYDFNGLCCSL